MLILSIVISILSFASASSLCHYQTWDWDSVQKKSVNHRRIAKPRADLSAEERGKVEGCGVCEEDQTEVRIGNKPSFQVCRRFEERFRRALERATADGFVIQSLVGYRVGKSKGALNSAGQRTQFSNHSYGTAIDINSESNGLYDFCEKFSPECKLIRGGPYRPGQPGAITQGSSIYRALIHEGFKWGGEINGKQKDFMHFSLDGM